MKVKITYTNGDVEVIDGYRVKVEEGVLKVRTSHDTSYRDDWENMPLVNIRKWVTE